MKVLYKDPNDSSYTKWYDFEKSYDIWYKDITMIFDYEKMDIPEELKVFLRKWSNNILEYMKTYKEAYPVKLAKIEFIYKDIIYRIYPTTVKATYKSNFLSEEPYDVSWDSLFEAYQKEIRDDMKEELGIIYTRYIGFLD